MDEKKGVKKCQDGCLSVDTLNFKNSDEDSSERRKRKASSSPALLEVGVTATPLGHSLQLGKSSKLVDLVEPSSLLGKLESFLPKMKAANEKLNEELINGKVIEKAVEIVMKKDDDEEDSAASSGPNQEEQEEVRFKKDGKETEELLQQQQKKNI